jgi:hypothetical protein
MPDVCLVVTDGQRAVLHHQIPSNCNVGSLTFHTFLASNDNRSRLHQIARVFMQIARVFMQRVQFIILTYFLLVFSSLMFIFFSMERHSLVGHGLLIIEAARSHSDTPQSIGLLWTSDQPHKRPLPDNTQHSQETDIHASCGIRTRNLSKRAIANPRLRPRGH